MTEEQVVQFIVAAKFSISQENSTSRCVDGRYENIVQLPGIAKPGGDAGDVLIAFGATNILGLSITPEAIVQAVVDAIGGQENFNFHTDGHAEEAGSMAGMGCGHIKHAKNDPAAYGVKQEQVDYVFGQLPLLIEKGAHQEVLHGDHAEQAVVVIHSETYSLKPLVRAGDDTLLEAFIYQQTLHAKQLDALARNLQMIIASGGSVVEEPVIRKALDDAFAVQLNQTLQRLAGGLPIYTVDIDESGDVKIK